MNKYYIKPEQFPSGCNPGRGSVLQHTKCSIFCYIPEIIISSRQHFHSPYSFRNRKPGPGAADPASNLTDLEFNMSRYASVRGIAINKLPGMLIMEAISI